MKSKNSELNLGLSNGIWIACFMFAIGFVFTTPACADPFWAKANMHMHTTNSDGNASVDDMVNNYKAAGYNIIGITDHSDAYHTSLTQCSQYTNLSEKFLCLNSAEEGFSSKASDNSSLYYHSCMININSVFSDKTYHATLRQFQDAINDSLAQGGFTIVAHPWQLGSTEVNTQEYIAALKSLNNYTAMEINQNPTTGIGSPWDDVLLTGKKVFGVGSDDAHNMTYKWIWTKVYMPEFTQEAYLDSVKNGYMYVTQGPTMDEQPFILICDLDRSAHMGQTVSGDGMKAVATIEPSLPTGKISQIKLIRDGDVISTKTDCPASGACSFSYEEPVTGPHYYRLYAIDSANKQIWSNPIWISQSMMVYGDISTDGQVTAFDAALVAQASVNSITLTADQTKAADVSGDGEVTAYDAALIAQKAVGLIDKFPVEG